MSDPGTEGDASRVFCALDPPPETRSLIGSWQRSESAEGGRLRAVDPDSLHVTLAFLGDLTEEQIGAAEAAIGSLDRRPVRARLLGKPVPVPRRRPRLLALELESPEAVALQAVLAGRLREAELTRAEARPFWPHLTVFRLAGRKRDPGRGFPRVQPLPDGDGHAFGFVRVALYRSNLRPEGASYSLLAANELPRAGGRQKR